MQRCNCTVRLGGDLRNTVEKTNVSPAEIVILTAIHGDGSVVNIRKTIMDKEPHRSERMRLASVYGQAVVDKLFPGEFTPLPVNLTDIAIGSPEDAEAGEPAEGEKAEAADDQAEAVDDGGETGALSEDDQLFVDSVNNAKTKLDLYQIAKDNEVDLSKAPDKLDDLKAAILTAMGFKK